MELAKAQAAIAHALEMVRSRPRWDGASSAIFHLAQRLAHKIEIGKKARTENLLRSLKLASPVSRLAVFGQISGLDLSGLTFIDCIFRDAEFHNCLFDEKTVFQRCRFDGDLTFENCVQAGRVQLIDCSLSNSAEEEWNKEAGRASKRIINQSTVRDALREILRKFLGPFGFSTIKEADRNSGPVARNPCREVAWDELFREKIIERHHISGVSGRGINIANDAATKHEVRNFLDNAALGPRLQHVLDEILKHK